MSAVQRRRKALIRNVSIKYGNDFHSSIKCNYKSSVLSLYITYLYSYGYSSVELFVGFR